MLTKGAVRSERTVSTFPPRLRAYLPVPGSRNPYTTLDGDLPFYFEAQRSSCPLPFTLSSLRCQ